MRYFGGKSRICKDIVEVIESHRVDGQTFLSPFVGGGWVEQYIKGPKILLDKHYYLIELYKELQKGWLPPTLISKEEYDYVRENKDEKPYLTGFVGFGCSYSGKWFGGYAKDNTDRNYCLNAYSSIMKKIQNGLLNDSDFACIDYRELDPINCLIYCDPPYNGTTQYDKSIVGEFDTDEFWEVMRNWSKNNTVIISEYSAPEDFKVVWEKSTKLDIHSKGCNKRVEKLFIYGGED